MVRPLQDEADVACGEYPQVFIVVKKTVIRQLGERQRFDQGSERSIASHIDMERGQTTTQRPDQIG